MTYLHIDIDPEQQKELDKMSESYEKLDKKTREEIIKRGFYSEENKK